MSKENITIIIGAFISVWLVIGQFNEVFQKQPVEQVLNQDSLLQEYISMFHHNAKVEILGSKRLIRLINVCIMSLKMGVGILFV